MATRLKTCRICRIKFEPVRFAQTCCSIPCAIEHANALKAKKQKKELKEAKAKLKPRADYLKEAQAIFNKFIRLRDKDETCISCNKSHGGQYHAGHFRSVGAAPELRFNEINCHKQCSVCNNYLSGNLLEYRRRLISKIGIDKVEWLEGPHEAKKYTIEEILAIKKEYQQKIKELERAGK